MTQIIQPTGENSVLFGEWAITNGYLEGAIVIHEGDLWAANDDIPANTAFAEGTTGETWERVLTTMKPTVNPQIRVSEEGYTAYGRLHVWGNKVFTAGHASGIGVLYGQGQPDDLGNSTELYCIDGAPDNWVKFQDILSNFYGLGDDGVLYVAGTNNNGSLGLGNNTLLPNSFQIIKQTHPTLYGEGIEVVDFWATNLVPDAATRASSCWVQVNDNGVLKLYSFGWNSTGSIGNNTTSTDAFTPYEHEVLRDKRVKVLKNLVISGESWSILITEDGEAWATGYNGGGQLGLGSTENFQSLQQCKYDAATYVSDAVDMDTMLRWGSFAATYILRADGTVWACGNKDENILGLGSATATAPSFVTYFNQVRSGPTTPLTNIVKIKATDQGLAALDNQGQVWMTGKNNDGMWGNGQAAYADGQTWATVKQGDIKNMWFSKTSRGFCAAYWLKNDNTFWSSGSNDFFQLGALITGSDPATKPYLNLVPVGLPRGEYPVQVRWVGAIQKGGDTISLLGAGIVMVSNSNKLYTWGRPYSQVSGVRGFAFDNSVRFPHCVNDFYDVRFL